MKKLLLSILFGGFAAAAMAQEPVVDIDSTYFHPAASMYVQGNSAGASNLVYSGLAEFPDNGKLLRLKELLDQQQKQNQDENKDQDQNQDENKDQQDQEQNKDQDKEQDPQDEDNQDQEQNEDQQDQNQDQNQDQEQQQDQAQQQPPSAEQMSKDEAERLLDAMKQEEENKRLQLIPVRGKPVQVDKDW